MRHFVQYHNPDKMGEWSPADGFYIVTKRKPACSKDDRVWLIGRRGKPRKYEYVLWMTFPVERAGPNNSGRFPDFPYSVNGSNGEIFDNVAIDQEPWFEDLRALQGNFVFGFQPINNAEIVKGLSKLAKLP